VAKSVCIVGAGPAGLIAAEHLAGAGFRVTVIERMPSPARKFLMAGRGGLNITHSEPFARFVTRYGAATPALIGALEAFPPLALRAWTEGLGEETFVGTSGRVFPRSFKASPLLRSWLARLVGLGVELRTRHLWAGWTADGSPRFQTPHGEGAIPADAVLLALGGASWPRLGSDGSWVPFLAGRGVLITPLKASNSGVLVDWSETFRTRFAGQPVKGVRLAIGAATSGGEMIVTAGGLEGGALYALSPAVREALAVENARLIIDLKPDLAQPELARRLAKRRSGDSLSNTLRKAAGLQKVQIGLLRESAGPSLPEDAATLAALIKALPLRLTGVQGLDRAISTAGGIALDGIDERFMLRALPGTFAAGEMLDWEAPTGGYLLQASFATGLAAARGVVDWLAER
jgi:uncharacterized flavoprotein (TIGR03862 family)